jgi:hypothetical protein
MRNRKRYYAVAYANTIRLAGPCESEEQAMIECYGMKDINNRMTVVVLPGNPKYLSFAKQKEATDALKEDHKNKTGNIIL